MTTNSDRRNANRRGHANEHMKTSLRNGGRIAGMGVLYDDYSEESGRPSYDPGSVKVHVPSDDMTPEERAELNGPVKTYRIEK